MSVKDGFPFDLCLVAEETGDDFERSLSVARSLRIKQIEFGSLWGQRIDRAPFGMLVKAEELLKEFEVEACVIATEAFKSVLLGGIPLENIGQDPHFLEHLDLVRAAVEGARFFGAHMVRVFSFRREVMSGLGNPSPLLIGGGEFPEEMVEKITEALKPALKIARDGGVVLAMENVRSCWCNSGRNTSRLLDAVDSPWLKVIWDPANAFVSGEDDVVGDGYEQVRSKVTHVHLKDAVVLDPATGLTAWQRIGDGAVGLQEVLQSLKNDSYKGCVSIETHWRPEKSDREDNTRKTYEGLMELLGQPM